MAERVFECVTFRLASGVERDSFLQASLSIGVFASNQPGFVSRQLIETEEGGFIDWVEWQSLETAKAAGAKIMSDPSVQKAMMMIDPESVVLRHGVEKQAA